MELIQPSQPFISQITAQAPGRINIIGEHTDYNDGFVLPAAIDRSVKVQIRRNNTAELVNITATDLKESFSFNLAQFQPSSVGWSNYIMGLVHELQQLGANISGFDAVFESNVPIGGGVSSSAALECSFAVALNELFGLALDPWQLIKASQMAEHHFVGIKCGIMDQFASMMGKKDHVMLLDCRSLEFQYFPIDLGKYQLLLLNTNVSHTLASSEYNTRRAECEEGVSLLKKELPEIRNLRDVTTEQLYSAGKHLSKNIFRRCLHVISENKRVLDAASALQSGNRQKLGELLYQSHFSLQNDYEVSCKELDFLVELTINKEYILGSRMMGGGFGGCTINIIEKDQTDSFIDQASTEYRKRFGLALTPINVAAGNGAGIIQSFAQHA